MNESVPDDTASAETAEALQNHLPRHSVLTPEGQIEAAGAFSRGLGSRYGADRVRRIVGRVALGTAVLLVVIAVIAATT